jgi:hypothetical protein
MLDLEKTSSPALIGLALSAAIAAAPPAAGALAAALDEVRVNPAVAIGYGNCPHCAPNLVPMPDESGSAVDETATKSSYVNEQH